MHVYHSQGSQRDARHLGEFPSHKLHYLVYLFIARLQVFLQTILLQYCLEKNINNQTIN